MENILYTYLIKTNLLMVALKMGSKMVSGVIGMIMVIEIGQDTINME